MLAASSRKHIASAGRLGSGPALGPQNPHAPLSVQALVNTTTLPS